MVDTDQNGLQFIYYLYTATIKHKEERLLSFGILNVWYKKRSSTDLALIFKHSHKIINSHVRDLQMRCRLFNKCANSFSSGWGKFNFFTVYY